MTHELGKMVGKPHDYKLCSHCNRINWYENEVCIDCSCSSFKENGSSVEKYIQNEYDFYTQEEGYTEAEADNVLIDV